MKRRQLRNLLKDEGGASIIELAFAAPIMAALIMGMSDMALAYSTTVQLEQAAQRTIEKVENQKAVASSYNSALTAEAQSAMSDAGFTTGNTITPDSWLECGTSTTHLALTADCPNATDTVARYVSVRIQRSFTPIFSGLWPGTDANGNLTVAGYAQVRMQ